MARLVGPGIPLVVRVAYDFGLSRVNDRRVAAYRNRVLASLLGSFGNGSNFSTGIKLIHPGRIQVAERCQFANSTILQGTAGLSFGADCLIGFENIFLTKSHRSDRTDIPVRDQGYCEAPVSLGDDVWTGCRVIVLPGVTIGAHTIVGSGAIVTRDLPSGVVAAGVPARVVKERGPSDAFTMTTLHDQPPAPAR